MSKQPTGIAAALARTSFVSDYVGPIAYVDHVNLSVVRLCLQRGLPGGPGTWLGRWHTLLTTSFSSGINSFGFFGLIAFHVPCAGHVLFSFYDRLDQHMRPYQHTGFPYSVDLVPGNTSLHAFYLRPGLACPAATHLATMPHLLPLVDLLGGDETDLVERLLCHTEAHPRPDDDQSPAPFRLYEVGVPLL